MKNGLKRKTNTKQKTISESIPLTESFSSCVFQALSSFLEAETGGNWNSM